MTARIAILNDLLSLEKGAVVSLVGGGGKTSLMFHLAQQLVAHGQRVLTTTTTKIFVPTKEQSPHLLVADDPDEIVTQARTAQAGVLHLTAAARTLDGGKLKGFAPAEIETIAEAGLFDVILVEADGSARRPLKAPAAHEPVIPGLSRIVIAVAGLEVIGEPLNEELVFRSDLAGERMGIATGGLMTEAGLARLVAHPLGFFKGAPRGADKIVFLNKADTGGRRLAADRIADLLRQTGRPAASMLLVGQARDMIVVHARHDLKVAP